MMLASTPHAIAEVRSGGTDQKDVDDLNEADKTEKGY